MIPSPSPHEANAIRLIKVVLLIAVGIQLPHKRQVWQFPAARDWLGMLALHAVQVAIEELRVAFLAQQNERVRERLEEAFDGRLDSLAGLRVVVHDQRHSVVRFSLDERLVKDGSQVAVLCRRDSREVVQERYVKEGELVMHVFQISTQGIYVAHPKLSHAEELVFAKLLL